MLHREQQELQEFRKTEKIRKKSWKELTNNEWEFLRRKGYINGCGGRNCYISQKIAKFFSGFFFSASCEVHDFGYWK